MYCFASPEAHGIATTTSVGTYPCSYEFNEEKSFTFILRPRYPSIRTTLIRAHFQEPILQDRVSP